MSYLTYDPATSKYPIRGFSNPNFIRSPDNSGDPYLDNVVLYLKGDGTNGSTAIVDESPTPKTITVVGNTNISTAQSKYGGSSIYFGGGGNYLTAPTVNFSGDFTFECWINAPFTSNGIIMGTYSLGNWFWYIGGDFLYVYIAGHYSNSTVIPADEWVHLASTRESGTVRHFVNGISIASHSNSTTLTTTNGTLRIGDRSTSSSPYIGYIDSLRITDGVARYTANFDPEADTHLAY